MTLGGRRFLLTLAIVAASVCLALGVSLPIIKLTKFVFFTYEHSLISTVNALIRSGQYRRVLIASGSARIPNGKRGKIRLKLNRAGRALVAKGKPAKIALVVTITRGTRSGTEEFRTTLKAKPKPKPRRRR